MVVITFGFDVREHVNGYSAICWGLVSPGNRMLEFGRYDGLTFTELCDITLAAMDTFRPGTPVWYDDGVVATQAPLFHTHE